MSINMTGQRTTIGGPISHSYSQRTKTKTTSTDTYLNGITTYPQGGPDSNRSGNWAADSGAHTQLSSRAQMLMLVMKLVSGLMNGDFGELMNSLGALNGQSDGGRMLKGQNPGFGQRRAKGAESVDQAKGMDSRTALAQVKPGEVRELKPGQSVRGANGTILTRGRDGSVKACYRDKNGQKASVEIKDGSIRQNGGEWKEMQNRGQFLKLPNGDVVFAGHAESSDGSKKTVRGGIADNVDNVAVDEKGKSNVSVVGSDLTPVTKNTGSGYSLNLQAAHSNTPGGSASFLNANFTEFTGLPVTRLVSRPNLSSLGVI